MACFIVPAGEAVVTTIVAKVIKKKEGKKQTSEQEIAFSEKLGWLNRMLWGGSGLLAFEHVWHGELSPFFPFLTAASNPVSMAQMLHEMAVSGTAMAVSVTLVWALAVAAADKAKKREQGSECRKKEAQKI